jgi:hypothetical protein
MATLEQAAKGMEKRLTKRANKYSKKVAKVSGKRSKKGKWTNDEWNERMWNL